MHLINSSTSQPKLSHEEALQICHSPSTVDYPSSPEIIFDRTLRFIYFLVPKIACSTIFHILYYLYFGENQDSSQVHFEDFNAIHSYSVQEKFLQESSMERAHLHSFRNKELLHEILFAPGWFRFVIKRNPYERIFSAWKDKAFWGYHILFAQSAYRKLIHNGIVEFEDFVDWVTTGRGSDQHTDPAYAPLLPLLPDLRWYDITELDSWLHDFKQHIKHHPRAAPLTLPHTNPGIPIGKSHEFYSQSIADKVYSYYQKDFEFFGYTRDSWHHALPSPFKRGADLLDNWFLQKITQRNASFLNHRMYTTAKQNLNKVYQLHGFCGLLKECFRLGLKELSSTSCFSLSKK